jgi:hypothetical protein
MKTDAISNLEMINLTINHKIRGGNTPYFHQRKYVSLHGTAEMKFYKCF